MKPRIDISNQNSFTIWESGAWNEKKNIGRSTLIAGPNGEQLQVIYDSSPVRSNFHFLFFAGASQVVATAFVRKKSNDLFEYDLSLSRINSLSTETIQGSPVARANMDVLWLLKEAGPKQFDAMIERSYNKERIGYKETYHTIITQAVMKALTKPEEQKLFWGTPRETNRDF